MPEGSRLKPLLQDPPTISAHKVGAVSASHRYNAALQLTHPIRWSQTR